MRVLTFLVLGVSLVACGSSNGAGSGGSGGSASANGGAPSGGNGTGAGASSASGGGGHASTSSSSSSSTGGSAGSATRSAGCGMSPPHAADFDGTATDGDGTTRSFQALIPPGYDASTPVALTFGYHGAGGTSDSANGYHLQDGDARATSIFVFPQGIDFQTYGVGWDDNCGGRDMVLFDHILADFEAHYCLDPSRVFAAGFSWGCDQATALACCRGDKIKAVGAASCTDEFGNPSDPKSYDNLPCPSSHRPAVRFTHDSSGGDAGYAKPLFTTTSKLFGALNGCSGGDALPAGQCTTHAGCAAPFVECPYDGLGHATPANWGPDTWAFFTSLP